MMRIVVKFPSHAYAELLADLEQIPPRTRAERMRLLASIGMTVLRSGQGMAVVNLIAKDSATANAEAMPEPVKTDASFQRVREKLKAGMAG
ncbi:MAG: hypothetical protein NTX45_22130 [Proteobacteria bacterium]|nr:hypothetical protein [Pseudomonadota bacterium]